MKVFSVYLNKKNQIENAEFIENAFSFKAFIFKSLWCFFNKLWSVGFILLAVESYIAFNINTGVMNVWVGSIISMVLMIYLGFTASQWKEIALKKRGYSFKENIVANNYLEAQLKFFNNIEVKKAVAVS